MNHLVVRDPEMLGGEPVFVGTRVPVKTLTDYIEGGDTLDAFLDDSRMTHTQAIEFLAPAREKLVEAVR
jgi:uncharacterized protein (DUF433 family)